MIYFDNSATTKPCEAAVAAMTKALTDDWANPSALYQFGKEHAAGGSLPDGISAAGAKPDEHHLLR